MNQFRTWGAALQSLAAELRTAASAASVKNAYGTPSFFPTRNLALHRAYQAWCEGRGIDCQALRCELQRMRSRGEPVVTQCLPLVDLLTTPPHEFNVRGEWTPEASAEPRVHERLCG